MTSARDTSRSIRLRSFLFAAASALSLSPGFVGSADAAPLVVWEGSHEILRAALRAVLAPHPRHEWPEVDMTDAYQQARAEVFARCRRVELPGRPGEAHVLHRLALHGVAPWGAAATGGADGRMIAYFRPLLAGGVAAWLDLP